MTKGRLASSCKHLYVPAHVFGVHLATLSRPRMQIRAGVSEDLLQENPDAPLEC